MDRLDDLYKSRIEMRNIVSKLRLDLREHELNLECIETEIEQINNNEENNNGQKS